MIRTSFSYMFIGLCLFSQLVSIGFSTSFQHVSETSLPKTYIFIFDINTITCPLCLDSISNLLDVLKNKPPEDIIGIVVCNDISLNSGRSRRIVKKQIKGFKIGNKIQFPLYIDYDGKFNCLNGRKALLVELAPASKTIIEFPINKK